MRGRGKGIILGQLPQTYKTINNNLKLNNTNQLNFSSYSLNFYSLNSFNTITKQQQRSFPFFRSTLNNKRFYSTQKNNNNINELPLSNSQSIPLQQQSLSQNLTENLTIIEEISKEPQKWYETPITGCQYCNNRFLIFFYLNIINFKYENLSIKNVLIK